MKHVLSDISILLYSMKSWTWNSLTRETQTVVSGLPAGLSGLHRQLNSNTVSMRSWTTIDDEQLHDVRCYIFCCYKMIMSMKRILNWAKTEFYVELKDDHVNETCPFPSSILRYSMKWCTWNSLTREIQTLDWGLPAVVSGLHWQLNSNTVSMWSWTIP